MSDDAPQTPEPESASAAPGDEPTAVTPEPPAPETAETLPPAEPPMAPPPPVPAAPPAPEPVIAEPAPPATTASGLPNPHGLPDIAVDRPEVAVGAAFGGGLLLALILKRFAR